MLKNITLGLIICVIVLMAGGMLLADPGGDDAATSVSSVTNNQEVGNKVCPVSGEKINEETRATYEYRGKIYNLCCSACIEEFKKNTDKYIQVTEEEKKNNK